MIEKHAKVSNTVVIGTIHLFSHDARILIDLGFTHSFMSTSLVKHIDSTLEPLDQELVISTPLGKTMIAKQVYKSYVVKIGEVELLANLILLDLQYFDVILGIDSLVAHHAIVDCYNKEVIITIPNQFKVIFKRIRSFFKIILALRAKRLL